MPCGGCFGFLGGGQDRNPLRIGATIPNFDLQTTKGAFKFHDWLLGETATDEYAASKRWTVFFSHPRDYTPVCTTELSECHLLSDKFSAIGCKLIGVSCDSLQMHHGWSKDIIGHAGRAEDLLAFPIIADAERKIVTGLGMLDPKEKDETGLALPARALVVLFDTEVGIRVTALAMLMTTITMIQSIAATAMKMAMTMALMQQCQVPTTSLA